MNRVVLQMMGVICLVSNLLAQPNLNYYWKGGSGNFNDPAKWWVNSYNSGQTASQAPISSNNVYFTAAAFSTTGAIISMTTDGNCKDMIWDDAIVAANAPTFTSTTANKLSLFGSLSLATNMSWGFQGQLYFKASSGVAQTLTRGKTFRIVTFNVELGAGAELRLMDNLTLENPAANNAIVSQGMLVLSSGHFNTNKKTLTIDAFSSRNGVASRRLTMDSSTVVVDGAVTSGAEIWFLDFTTTNHAGFSALGSHLKFRKTIGDATILQRITFNGVPSSVVYDSITFEHQASGASVAPNSMQCNYLAVGDNMTSLSFGGGGVTTNTLKLGKGATILSNGSRIILEQLIAPTGCDYATIATLSGGNNTTLQKRTSGNIAFSNLVLSRVAGDPIGGRSYTATNCINLRSSTGITYNTAATSCYTDLWFRGATSDWHTLSNWRDASGNIPTALPNINTNVYFDNLSFVTPTDLVINAPAYCRDIKWTGTRAGARILIGTNATVFVRGTVDFPANMGGTQGALSSFFLCGDSDSLITRGVLLNHINNVLAGADYTIIDTLRTLTLYQYGYSAVRARNAGIAILKQYNMASRSFDNTRVYFEQTMWPASSEFQSDFIQYTNNSTFYYNAGSYHVVSGILPNVVVNSPGWYISYTATVWGDITFNVSCQTSMQVYAGTFTGRTLHVTGNMNVNAGNEVVLTDNAPTNDVYVIGNLNLLGNCSKMTTIRTYNGTSVPLRVDGVSNIQYSYLQGLTSNTAIVANNSFDGGGNTNITFTAPTGRKYYWRASKLAPTVFAGNWDDANFWTLDSNKLVGDGLCVPTLADDVVFDARSFSGVSNSCTVNKSSFCRNLTCYAGIKFNQTGIGIGTLYVGGSFVLHPSVQWAFTGYLQFVGNAPAVINTAGVQLAMREVVFNNPAGQWDLQNDFAVRLPSGVDLEIYGLLRLLGGTLRSNNYNITLDNRFYASGNTPRSLVLGSSIWTMNMIGSYNATTNVTLPWNAQNSTNMTVSGGTIRVLNGSYAANGKRFYMGDNLTYGRLEITDTDEIIQLYGNASYIYGNWSAGIYVDGNNLFDSLFLDGGFTYKFRAGSIQTLNAPHGRITSGGSAGDFVFIESATPGQLATFHKPYGSAFCVDYIKVKDMDGTRLPDASVPALYQPIQPFLEFQTGVNSDNVSGTAIGLWKFNLLPLVLPQFTGSNSIALCTYAAPSTIPISMTGTSPYLVKYSWQNAGITYTDSISVVDNDNDPNTPVSSRITVTHQGVPLLQYMFDVTTSRCAIRTAPIVAAVNITQPVAMPLVSVNRTSICELYNEAIWHTFVDDVDKKPVVSLFDKVNASDVTALGVVTNNVYFDPTIQYYNWNGINYPYLQRHWKIEPTNNSAAKVRLYFTQAELNALAAQTFHGQYGGQINPATGIRVLKFASGTIGVGTPVAIPHTVVPLVGADAAAFTTTAGVICVEFDVPSFSHFIIIPTDVTLLSLSVKDFNAKSIDNKAVRTDWEMTQDQDIAYYTVERSADAIQAEAAGEVVARQQATAVAYTFIDQQPYQGVSYYRIKAHKIDGTVEFSDWRKVEITNGNYAVVYPNPTNDILHVGLRTASQTVTVRLVDVLGRTAHIVHWDSTQSNTLQINTKALESGVYTLLLEFDNHVAQQKRVVIQH